MGTHISHAEAAKTAEFQVFLRLVGAEEYDDRDLEEIAEMSVEALCNEAPGLALGVVASVDLDRRLVELEMTIEAAADSELHQKMALVLAALERGAPLKLCESTASRAPDREPVPA